MRKLLALAVLAVAAGVVPVATAAPRVTLTLRPSALKVLYGKGVVLSGRVTGKPAGTPVEVLAWRYGRSSPAHVATVRTRARGRFAVRVRPVVQTRYEVRDATVTSNAVIVHVQPALGVRELGDGRVWGHVSAGTSLAGRHVQLQQLVGGAWHTIARAKLTRTSSALFAPLHSTRATSLRVALSVNQAGAGYLGGTSHALAYRALTLTLEPSSFRVLYGRALTLHGRLWNGRSGQSVTVEAWTYGHSSPRRIATVTTRANGTWSLRVVPRVQTTYQASWTKLYASPRERVGVAPAVSIRRLTGHRVLARVTAGRSLRGRSVKLQRLVAPGVWRTVAQKQLDRASRAVFAVSLPASQLRVALSVNEAGAGYLGSASRTLVYKP